MEQLTVFISSTVKDLGPVRVDLRRWLERDLLAVVRTSEHNDFPVDEGVTSHDACLRAMGGCHLVVVLIGDRRGGNYHNTDKSITRREYDEAINLSIPVVVLVRDEVNRKAEQWSKGELAVAPFDHADTIVSFINYVRKARTDNWMHLWNGSFHDAKLTIQSRLNALFTSYQKPRADLLRLAKGLAKYADARLQVDKLLLALSMNKVGAASDRLNALLVLIAELRGPLFGFEQRDRWNIAVYVPRENGDLEAIARQVDQNIERHDRVWPPGEGHVGAAWKQENTLIATDMALTGCDEFKARRRGKIAQPLLSLSSGRTGAHPLRSR